MTINVVLKCAAGLVLGCDSLVTLSVGGQIRYVVNYANKLFAFASYPVGAVLNGAGNIGGRPMADIVRQFVKNLPEYDEDTFVLQTLVTDLRDALALEYQSAGSDARFELIAAGFTSTNRFGEIYSVDFPSASVISHHPGDQDFGIYHSGQSTALERFIYGFDRQHLLNLYQSFEDLFSQARDYILEELSTQGINIPDDLIIQTPQISRFNIFSGVSHIPVDQQTTVKDILEGSREKYSIPFEFLSLQEAINLVVFLMQCAYAEQNLTITDSGHPVVGSEMTVATITREEGLQFIRRWRPVVLERMF